MAVYRGNNIITNILSFFFFFSFFTDSKDQTLHTGRIGHSPEDACNVAPLKVKQRALDRKDYH